MHALLAIRDGVRIPAVGRKLRENIEKRRTALLQILDIFEAEFDEADIGVTRTARC